MATLIFTSTSCTAEFAPKSGEELKTAVDSITNRTGDFVPVDIDTGNFTFVLIKIKNSAGNTSYLVRGRAGPEYQFPSNVADPVTDELENAGYKFAVLSGGKIIHDPVKKTIDINGACRCDARGDAQMDTNIYISSRRTHVLGVFRVCICNYIGLLRLYDLRSFQVFHPIFIRHPSCCGYTIVVIRTRCCVYIPPF